MEGQGAGGGEVGESKGLVKQLWDRHGKDSKEDGGETILKGRSSGGQMGSDGAVRVSETVQEGGSRHREI